MNSITAPSESTSASLIARARDADDLAWERLSSIYGPLVYRWCRRRGLQDADSADVVQEVFRAVAVGLSTFEPGRDGGFRGWLYGITRHKLADHFRRKEPTRPLLVDGDIAVASLDVRDRSLEGATEGIDLLQADDLTVVLHAALDAIRNDFDAHNWEAFERTALHGEAAVDVAANLNLTPVAVRQAKFRILQRLRRELDGLL